MTEKHRTTTLREAVERFKLAISYATPQREWVGLTPDEILDMFDDQGVYGSKWLEFARAVEAKLKEKNI